MRCTKELHQQMTNQKNYEEIDLMIIYSRLIKGYLIYPMLTSPPWGNGEVVLRLGVAQNSGHG